MAGEGRPGGLTGTRIRERRQSLGLKQAELARLSGISASYLNLIEHNRRRIGGKLLLSLAAGLGVEPSALSEGAEAAQLAALRQAAAGVPGATAELDRIEEFSGRFPGWAGVVAGQARRLQALEQAVEALTDRLTHDPHLAASLHEVLSTVTAIHSSAEILVAERTLEPEWRDRFHRNIAEDSARLADGARRLVAELEDGDATRPQVMATPEDAVEAFLAARDFHLPELEAGEGIASLLDDPLLEDAAARAMAARVLQRYAEDAARLPADRVTALLPQAPGLLDPVALAAQTGVDPACMMRRLASLPRDSFTGRGLTVPGLVACDASGTLTFRKPLGRFALPRIGAACPLWPLFQALSRPMMPVASVLRLAGRTERVFRIHAIAQPAGPPVANRDPIFEAHMLFQPAPDLPATPEMGRIGVTCRICPKSGCRGRRDPSILAEVA